MGKGKSFAILATYIIIIFSSQFFNFVNWKNFTGGYDQSYYVFYVLVFFLAIFDGKRNRYKLEYGHSVNAICYVSFLCAITIIVKGESLLRELPFFLIPMAIMLYYLYIEYNVSEKSLIKCLTYIGLFVFFIQLIQQIFPNSAVFGIIDPNTDNPYDMDRVANQRNGVWRYIIPTPQITVFCMCYWYTKLLEKRTTAHWILFFSFAASVYLYMTRQIIFAAIASIIVFSLFIRNNEKSNSKIIPLFFILAVVIFFVPLFGELVSTTREGGDSTDYRMLAYVFYFDKIIQDFVSFFFGSGHPMALGDWQGEHLHPSDIGFVGEVFHKGIFFLLIYLVLVFKILVRHKRLVPSFVWLYVMCSLMHSMMAFPYRSGLEYVVWAIVLYLAEKHIQNTNNITKQL